MIRLIAFPAAAWLIACICHTTAFAAGDDFVSYRTEQGEVVREKDFKESEKGIILNKSQQLVKPWQVVRVDYGSMPLDTGATNDSDRGASEQSNAEANFNFYGEKFLESLDPGKNTDPRVKKELKLRHAFWAARMAEQALDKPAKNRDEVEKQGKLVQDAVAKLKEFSNETNGWRVWTASRTAARLLIQTDDLEKAGNLLEEAADNTSIAEEYRNELRVTSAAMQIHSHQFSRANRNLEKLSESRKPSRELMSRIEVLKEGAKLKLPDPETLVAGDKPSKDVVKSMEKLLATMVNSSSSASAQASGHNILGETYAHYQMNQEAIREFLWAVVVHSEDRDETLVALQQLIKLYEKVGKKDRADRFRERLIKMRQ